MSILVSSMFFSAVVVSSLLAVLAASSDFKRLTIPNSYSMIIGLSFCVAAICEWFYPQLMPLSSLLSHVLAGAIIFLVTILLFSMKKIGAGDSKLASALAVWCGLSGVPAFLFYMALTGGLLASFSLIVKYFKLFPSASADGWIGQVRDGNGKVPYGIALAVGAMITFYIQGYYTAILM